MNLRHGFSLGFTFYILLLTLRRKRKTQPSGEISRFNNSSLCSRFPIDHSTFRLRAHRKQPFTSMLCFVVALALPYISQPLSCYYYRIRADEPLTSANTIARNCSSSITRCVKIIHKSEAEETTHIDTYLEGRCAFSQDECATEHMCFPEETKKLAGFSVTDYKCCSPNDLSNESQTPTVLITTFILYFQHLLE